MVGTDCCANAGAFSSSNMRALASKRFTCSLRAMKEFFATVG
jgi:hypothetical protein